MKKVGKFLWVLFIMAFVMIPVSMTYAHVDSQDQEEELAVLVGRISHIDGQLLRYVPEEEDWVVTVKDAPFGIEDVLYSSFDGRAEIIMPNNTWARVDGDTQIQLIVLTDESTEIDLASGKARLYNKSSDAVIKATTPFGNVTAPAETIFDLYVGENAVEIIALKGTVSFVHNSADTKYEVISGSSSIFADSVQVTASEGRVNQDWDAWNINRDILWADRMEAKGKSAQYLPSRLHDEAYLLEKHGRWERVYYDGAYYNFWRPVYVSAGWAPFTMGRWTVWCGDNVWIPHEPFGYITHHYGNWIFTHGYWYWAPPVTHVMVHAGLPLLHIGFGWYPGRVAWIHSGIYVGWIPLSPYERYYCHRRWGRRSFAVGYVNRAHFYRNINRYRHRRHAVIIHRKHFYRGRHYRNVRIRNIPHATVIKRYRMAPVINNAVLMNYRTNKKRYNFTDAHVGRKPQPSVIKRIKRNHLAEKLRAGGKAETIRQNLTNTGQGRPSRNIWTRSSKNKDRTGRIKQVNKSLPASQFKGGRFKRKVKVRAEDRRKGKINLRRSQKKKPPQPERNNELRLKDQRRGRGEVKKAQKKRSLKPVKPLLVRRKNQRVPEKEVQKGLKRRSAPPDRQVRHVRQRPPFNERTERRVAKQNRPKQRQAEKPKMQAQGRRREKTQGERLLSRSR
ncbi:MAG: FecR domain-containing protein [Deltaproteobacteria bacterium]|nr:FecR domain-containing protein [Deltaproteobacteria bacterium]